MGWVRTWTIFLAFYVACARSTCYYPNGDVAKNDTPCRSEGNSTCCGPGLACLSNGVCGITQYPSDPKSTFGLGEWFVTGSCTDESFTDAACLNRCLNKPNGERYNVFVPVRQCIVGNRDRWYCSNAQTREQTLDEVCFAPSQTDEFLFQMDGNPSTVTIIGHELGTAAPTSPGSVTTPISIGATSTVPASSGTSSSAPAADPITPESKQPDYSIPIGVGVGVPLGLLVSGILAFLYLRHRRQAATKGKKLQEIADSDSRPPIYAYRAELSDWSRVGELSTNQAAHELSADHNRVGVA